MSVFTHSLSTNNYGPYRFIVATSPANGTHTTLDSALSASVSGDTILLRDSITENVTLKSGVTIVGLSPSSGTGSNPVSITGKLIDNGVACTCTIANIKLITNSDFALVLSNAGSIITFNKCYLYALNNTLISFSALCVVYAYDCYFSSATSSYTIFASSGFLSCYNCQLFPEASPNTPINPTNGVLGLYNCQCGYPLLCSGSGGFVLYNSYTYSTNDYALSCTGTGSLNIYNSYIQSASGSVIQLSSSSSSNIYNSYVQGQNSICIETSGTSSVRCSESILNPNSNSAASIGANTNLYISNCELRANTTNAITGAGTVFYSGVNFTGSSKLINTTTQVCPNSGTFTPTIAFGGASVGITYTTQTGTYYRKDNTLFFNLLIVLSNKGSSVGNATIGGLPFTSAATYTYDFVHPILNITAASSTYFFSELGAAATSMTVYSGLSTSGGLTNMTNTTFANNTIIRCQGTYFI